MAAKVDVVNAFAHYVRVPETNLVSRWGVRDKADIGDFLPGRTAVWRWWDTSRQPVWRARGLQGTLPSKTFYWTPKGIQPAKLYRRKQPARTELAGVLLVEGESSAWSADHALNRQDDGSWWATVGVLGGSSWPSGGDELKLLADQARQVPLVVWGDDDDTGKKMVDNVRLWANKHDIRFLLADSSAGDARDVITSDGTDGILDIISSSQVDTVTPPKQADKRLLYGTGTPAARNGKNRTWEQSGVPIGEIRTAASQVLPELLTQVGSQQPNGTGNWTCFNREQHRNNDRRPSLSVYSNSGGYRAFKCHGCGITGDGIQLLKDQFGWAGMLEALGLKK